MNAIKQILSGAAIVLHQNGGTTITRADGNSFVGLVEDVNPIDYGLPLGEDTREQAILHVLQQALPTSEIQPQEALTDEDGGSWRVVKRLRPSIGIDHQFYIVRLE